MIRSINKFNLIISLFISANIKAVYDFFSNESYTILSSCNSAGISESLKDFKSTINSFNEIGSFFIMIINTLFSLLSFLGVKAILVIIAAFFISSFLKIFGFEKNKKTFFASILIIDVFWIVWMLQNNKLLDSGISLIKTNAIIFLPSLLIIFGKKFFSVLYKYIVEKYYKKEKFNRQNLLTYSENLIQQNSMFISKLNSDLLKNPANELFLSSDTIKSFNQLSVEFAGLSNYINRIKESQNSKNPVENRDIKNSGYLQDE